MYICISVDSSGKNHFRVSTKTNKSVVLRSIMKLGMIPTLVFSINPLMYIFLRLYNKPREIVLDDCLFFKLISRLSSMISSGMTLVRAVKCVADDGKSVTGISVICRNILRNMSAGHTFHDAIKIMPNKLNPNYMRIIMCAERGGYIADGLSSLKKYIEAQTKLKKQMTGSLIYPAAIASIGLLLISVVLFFVIPKFQSFFAGNLNAELPAITRAIFSISEFFNNNAQFTILTSAAIIFISIKSKKFRNIFYNNFFIRKLTNEFQIGMFSLNLSMLLKNNISLKEALVLSTASAGEKFLCQSTLFTALNNGKRLHEAMSMSKKFPHFYIESIKTGESSGSMQNTIKTLANYYLSSYDRQLKQFLKLLEPSLIVVLAVFVAIIVFALFLPMISMLQTMSFM